MGIGGRWPSPLDLPHPYDKMRTSARDPGGTFEDGKVA